MAYYVFAPNGQRFGPADLATLQQWVSEGRVLPTSMVEDDLSGMRMAASAIHGLSFGPAPFAQQVQTQHQNPYGSPGAYGANPYAGQAPSNYYRGDHRYPVGYPVEQKNKIVAGLLAFFFGFLGVHGFYLGNVQMGVILLVCWFGSLILSCISIGIIGILFIGVINLIQAILYWTASDADFHQKYVVEKRWL